MTVDAKALVAMIADLYAKGRHQALIEAAERAPDIVAGNLDAAFMLALAYVGVGNFERGGDTLRALVARYPQNADMKAALCKVLIVSGREDEAQPLLAELEAAARARPQTALALADAYLQAGRAADAHACLAAAAAKIDDPRFDIRLAETSIRIGQPDAGVVHARRAYAKAGLTPATLNVAGPAALLAGDERLITECVAVIDRLDATAAGAILDFWIAMLMAGDHLRAAAVAAEKAAALAPTPMRLRLLADLRLSMRNVAGAAAAANAALALDPADADAMVLAARCKIFIGEIDAAKAELFRALETNPDAAAAYDYLTQLSAKAVTPAMRAQMETLATSGRLGPDAAPKLLLALARADEIAGDFTSAFDRVIEGKSIIARHASAGGRGYNPVAIDAMTKTVRQAFAAAPQAATEAATQAPRMIFIVGMPRSGTSLVEQILASHPQVYGAGELAGMLDNFNSLMRFGKSPADIEARVRKHGADFAREYLAKLPPEGRAAPFCTDKHPLNFWSIGLIKTVLPDARIVHVVRPAADTCLSILRVRFFGDYSFANEIDSVAHYYAAYERMMAHWRSIFAGAIHDLDYESLTRDPARETRALLAYGGLPWDDACLEFHNAKREVYTHSAAQVREPIHDRSAERRRRYGESLKPLEDALARYRRGASE